MESDVKNRGWNVEVSAEGIEFFHANVGNCIKGSSSIQINNELLLPDAVYLEHRKRVSRFNCGLVLSLAIEQNAREITVFPELENRSENVLAVGDVVLMDFQADWSSSLSSCFVNGRTMVDNTGLGSLDGDVVSNAVIGLTDHEGRSAFAAGAIRPDDAWYDFRVVGKENGAKSFQVICRLENTLMEAGTVRRLSPIRFYAGTSLSFLLERYAEDTAEQMVPLAAFREPPAGWCSWYHYYGTDDVDEIRKNMRAIRSSPLAGRLQVIQVDDGWNLPEPSCPRCWGDWESGSKFPDGMKALADEIHDNGFQAGLWLAPFSVDEGSRLYKEHPEWLVHSIGSKDQLDPLADCGGVFGLDLTRPDVQEFVRSTFRRVFNEWGFDYIKIDFLAHGASEGVRFDQTKTGIEAFRIGMKIICEEAGPDRFILNCGSPVAASVGLCDGMRIGLDVGGRWFAPMNMQEWQYGNCCLKAAANSTIWRQWMQRVWWHNDPDCVILRNQMTDVEWNTFKDHPFANSPVCPEDFTLTSEETMGWLRLIWLSGGMLIVSEDMTTLKPEHWAALERCWPINTAAIRRLDRCFGSETSVFKTVFGDLVLGFFNLSDIPVSIALSSEEAGIEGNWAFEEVFSRDVIQGNGEPIVFPELPAHAGRLWRAVNP